MLSHVRLLDQMDESMWTLLQRNLNGLTEEEADWRPHPAANPVRWIIGHLAWFEEWAHDALAREGRYLTDHSPIAFLDDTIPALVARFASARTMYRARIAALTDESVSSCRWRSPIGCTHWMPASRMPDVELNR